MLSLLKTKIEFHYLSLTSANCHCENTILFKHMIYANQPVNSSNMVPCIYAYFQPPPLPLNHTTLHFTDKTSLLSAEKERKLCFFLLQFHIIDLRCQIACSYQNKEIR